MASRLGRSGAISSLPLCLDYQLRLLYLSDIVQYLHDLLRQPNESGYDHPNVVRDVIERKKKKVAILLGQRNSLMKDLCPPFALQ